MPLTVAGDERYLSELHERLLRTSPFEVGVIIGCVSAGRLTVLRLVRSPDPDDGAAPKSAKSIDPEWVGAHAQQAGHALPGGIAVIGFYVCAKAAEVKEAESALAPQLRKLLAGGRLGGGAACLLALPTDSRKVSARACVPVDASSSGAGSVRMEVAELKLGKGLPAPLHRFEMLLQVDVTFLLRVPAADSAAKRASAVASALTLALRPAVELLKNAVCTIDGQPVVQADAPVAKLAATARTGAGGQLCSRVKLYARAPPLAASGVAGAGGSGEEGETAGALFEARCAGCVHGCAYAGPKEAVGTALDWLRADAARSLERRVQLLRDSLADAMEEAEEEEADDEGEREGERHTRPGALVGRAGADVRPLARRRLLQLGMAGGVWVADLSLPDDEAEDLTERLALVGGAGVGAGEQPESAWADGGGEGQLESFADSAAALASLGAAACSAHGSANAGAAPGGATRTAEGGHQAPAAQQRSMRLPVLAAVLVAAIAVLVTAGLGLGRGTAPHHDPAAVGPGVGLPGDESVVREIHYPVDAEGRRAVREGEEPEATAAS